jgi:hypothetical protein
MEHGGRLPQTSIEPYTAAECVSFDGVYTQSLRIGEFDSPRPDFLSWNYFPPLYTNQV